MYFNCFFTRHPEDRIQWKQGKKSENKTHTKQNRYKKKNGKI